MGLALYLPRVRSSEVLDGIAAGWTAAFKSKPHFLSHFLIHRVVSRPGVNALRMEHRVSEFCDGARRAITEPGVPERRKAKAVLDTEYAQHLFRFLRRYRSFLFELACATHDYAV